MCIGHHTFYFITILQAVQWAVPLDHTGRKTLPPSTSLPVMGETAGVNTASRARWAEGFHKLSGHVFDLERDGLRQVVLCPRLTMMTTYNHRIGRRPGQQGPRLPPDNRTEVSSVLLVHHGRFEEETTPPSALGTQGH